MKKYSFITFLICVLLSSCQSIEPFTIDYMLPAEINFPSALKKVAIVNNMPTFDYNRPIREEKGTLHTEEETSFTEYFHGNANITTESLAHSLAQANYFDAVIICDSALRKKDTELRPRQLTNKEIYTLTQELGADFIIALDNVQIKAIRKIEFNPYFQAYFSTTDAKVHTALSIYIPERKPKITTLQTNDSIFWEEFSGSFSQAENQLIASKELISQASDFAGTSPINKLIPHWKKAQRYLFVGGSVPMRDAAIYIRENNWKEAIQLWEQAYKQKKGKKKIQAAHNLAVGLEMQDNIVEALKWAHKAQEIAYQTEKVEEKKTTKGIDASDAPFYAMTSFYVAELEMRNAKLSQLNMQMERFEE